jgi:CheY-like chemotaxis protein
MDTRPIAVVVDDSKAFLMYLSLLLNRMNLEVVPVSDAAEALELCRVTRPQLMTLDLIMPGMDGLEALRSVRGDEELADLPVIMITSFADKHRQWEALSLGCVDVLDKPVDLRRLHKAIQRCDLYPGGRRRYLRTPFERAVTIRSGGSENTVQSLSLSERGIFVRTTKQLARGVHVDVDIPLSADEILTVGGSVIYGNAGSGGSVVHPGVAIKFDRLTMKSSSQLAELVEQLLIGDIVAEQCEPVVKPG